MRTQELPFILLSVLFPLIFTTLWLSTNNQFPTADATDFLLNGYAIYHHFTDNGFWYGLQHFDIARGWRPIFFAVLTFPFMLVSHGNLYFSFQAVAVSCVIASGIYVYLLSRFLLDRVPAVIAANLICLLSFVQAPILTFFAECALFPAIIASIYYLIKSDYFREKKNTYAFIICFSLAIVIRPVEAITELMFVLMVFLSIGYYQKIFSLKQIITVIAISFSVLFLFFFCTSLHFLHHFPFHPIDGGKYDIKLAKSIYVSCYVSAIFMLFSWLMLAIMNLVPWCKKRYTETRPLNDPPLILVFSAIFFLTLLWFLPNAFELYVWVYRTAIGDLADNSAGMHLTGRLASAMVYFLEQEGIIVIAGVLLAAFAGFFLIGKQELRKICFSTPFIYTLLLIPFPLWEILNTHQSAPRKLSIAFPALLLALLLIALQRGRYLKLRTAMIAGLIIAQFILAISTMTPRLSQFQPYSRFAGLYPPPITLQPNPHDEILTFLEQQIRDNKLKHVMLEVSSATILPVDPFLMTMMSRVKGATYTFGIPYVTTPWSDEELQKINKPGNAIFITDKKINMVISEAAANAYYKKFENEYDQTVKGMYRVLYYYSANKLAEIGWKPVSCIQVRAFDNVDYQGCLLMTLSEK